jgi:D-alanyl-D-alanine carboxypeptidase/D-alanyl-D-alanine-endopeptidase (penicillin-binding protein 4)
LPSCGTPKIDAHAETRRTRRAETGKCLSPRAPRLRVRHVFYHCLALLLLSACATAAPPPAPALASTIDPLLAAPGYVRDVWGIVVEDDAGRVLYERNRHTILMTASNRKLFAAAAVAGCNGLETSIPTELWIDGTVVNGTLQGDAIIKGYGDPSLAGRYYEADRDLAVGSLLEALLARGIQHITGDVIADVSAFDRTTWPGSWQSGNLGADYAAPVDALAWNENVVGVKVDDPGCRGPIARTDPAFVPISTNLRCGAEGETLLRATPDNRVVVEGALGPASAPHFDDLLAVADPALYAAQAFRDSLVRHGVTVGGMARVNAVPRVWGQKLATHESPPLFAIVSTMLQASQNLYAEMLLKRLALGEKPASYGAATAVERTFLTNEVGLDPASFAFADGSGLSSWDLATPDAIVRLLRWINQPERRHAWWMMLAVPGEPGTLRKRLLELNPRLRGKTGTIHGVSALSGMVSMPEGGMRYFAIVVNHHTGEASATKAIDAIARAIAGG